MTNLEKYDKAFLSNLKVTKDQLPGLKYRGIEAWDSVAHMDSFAIITLVSELEDAFDIMMEMKDILDFNSYEHGKVVLKEVYGVDVEK